MKNKTSNIEELKKEFYKRFCFVCHEYLDSGKVIRTHILKEFVETELLDWIESKLVIAKKEGYTKGYVDAGIEALNIKDQELWANLTKKVEGSLVDRVSKEEHMGKMGKMGKTIRINTND